MLNVKTYDFIAGYTCDVNYTSASISSLFKELTKLLFLTQSTKSLVLQKLEKKVKLE